MVMPAIHRRWMPEEVRRLNDECPSWPRYELIDGELLVTPSPGHPHQLAIGELHLLIAPYVDREGLGLTFLSPSDVTLDERSLTQPDLYVVRAGPGADAKALVGSGSSGLLLTVEVISPSSVRIDRVTKRDFYMDAGVAEYWVVDLDARMVERWTLTRNAPLVERATLTWQPSAVSRALTIDLPRLFERIGEKSAWARAALER